MFKLDRVGADEPYSVSALYIAAFAAMAAAPMFGPEDRLREFEVRHGFQLSGQVDVAEAALGEDEPEEIDRAWLTDYARAGAPVERYPEAMARCRRLPEGDLFVHRLLCERPEWDR